MKAIKVVPLHSNIKQVTLLGSGTSTGVPEPGCFCRVCLSNDPQDKRSRTSALVETFDHKNILIDCSPDFHRQSILAGIDHVDAILLTHEHYDHIGGLDDLRTFAWYHPIRIIASKRVLEAIRYRLHYYFGATRYAGAPEIFLEEIDGKTSFNLYGLHVIPIELMHGKLPILGYRIDDFVFFTDLKTIAPEELAKANAPKLFFVNALRATKPHPTHQTLEEALELVRKVESPLSVIIHLSHHAPLQKEFPALLPPHTVAGYDGITFAQREDGFHQVEDNKTPLQCPEPYHFEDLGQIDYEKALGLQKKLFEESLARKKEGKRPRNHLLFCEHNLVYTIGKHGNPQNLLQSEDWLCARGIKLFHIERGGDITFHGPGQLVGYPIFDLQQYGMGIKDFVHTMEECIIDVLRANAIHGGRIPGATGIWVGIGTENERKICAIGVYASRYVTMHGFALNVFTDLSYFSAINPCGFTDKGVTSLEKEMKTPTSMALVKQQVEEAFHRRFRKALKETQEKKAP